MSSQGGIYQETRKKSGIPNGPHSQLGYNYALRTALS